MKKLSRIDREALERAIETRNSSEPGRREQVDDMLRTRAWFSVAHFCCYHCQSELIRPRLWWPIPADIEPSEIEIIIATGDDGVGGGHYAAAKMLRRMLRAGLSRYEPEPLKKLAEIKQRRQAAAEPEPAL